jgi:Fungal protein kinase
LKIRPDVGGFATSCATYDAAAESPMVVSEGRGPSDPVEDDNEGDLEDEGEDEWDQGEDDGEDEDEKAVSQKDRGHAGVTDFRKLELSFEFKRKLAHDGFRQHPLKDLKNFVIDDNLKTRGFTRAQITTYVTEQMARQHRHLAFSVLIAQDYAQFIRWDRSAAIVSRRFNYRNHPTIMAQFLWRFNHMTLSQRGVDTTVSYDVSEAEIGEAEDLIKDVDPDAVDESYPWIKITVLDEHQERDRFFIARKPRARTDSLTGRATRGYIAVEVGTRKAVFLKDSWRVSMDGFVKEGVTLKQLNEDSVPHVPKYVCGGDVPGQQTVSDAIVKTKPSWLCGNPVLRSHTHYRLVMDFIGKPLHKFASTRILLQAVHHSLLGE